MNCSQHPTAEAVAYCQRCGKPLCTQCVRTAGGMNFCEACLAEGRVTAALRSQSWPSPFLAGLLGLIPGVGAMYNGQLAKALAHVVIFGILVALAHTSVIFALLIPAWILYQVFEAAQTASARLEGRPLPDHLGLNDIGSQWFAAPANQQSTPPPVSAAPPQLQEESRRESPFKEPVGAIVLIVIGFLLLLKTLGVFQAAWLGRTWPFLLVVFGAWVLGRQLLEEARVEPPEARRFARAFRGPSFLILLGILWSLQQWNVLGFSRSWPSFLILAGFLALFERAEQSGKPRANDTGDTGGKDRPGPGISSGETPSHPLALQAATPRHESEGRIPEDAL